LDDWRLSGNLDESFLSDGGWLSAPEDDSDEEDHRDEDHHIHAGDDKDHVGDEMANHKENTVTKEDTATKEDTVTKENTVTTSAAPTLTGVDSTRTRQNKQMLAQSSTKSGIKADIQKSQNIQLSQCSKTVQSQNIQHRDPWTLLDVKVSHRNDLVPSRSLNLQWTPSSHKFLAPYFRRTILVLGMTFRR
jgi:hypothetical protein